jgi:hypothetical protein
LPSWFAKLLEDNFSRFAKIIWMPSWFAKLLELLLLLKQMPLMVKQTQPVVSANLINRVYLHENVSNTVQQQWTKLMWLQDWMLAGVLGTPVA